MVDRFANGDIMNDLYNIPHYQKQDCVRHASSDVPPYTSGPTWDDNRYYSPY